MKILFPILIAVMLSACSCAHSRPVVFADESEKSAEAWACVEDPEKKDGSLLCVDIEVLMLMLQSEQLRVQPQRGTTEL